MTSSHTRGKLLLILVATLVSLAIAEAALRIHYALSRPAVLRDLAETRPTPAPGSPAQLGDMIQLSANPSRIFELRPNLDVVFQGTPVRTNARGWRGPEHPYRKPPGTIRIVGIGDSVMFGWGVRERQRYGQRLEGLLNRHFPERRWEVITLACPGYNLAMELDVLERDGLRYDPDLILYGYVANDACLPNFVANEFDVYGFQSILWQRIRGQESALPRLIGRRQVVHEDARASDFVTRLCTPESVDPAYADLVGEESFRRSLDRLAQIESDTGIPIVLVAHPLRTEFALPEVPAEIRVIRAPRAPHGDGSEELPPQLRISARDHHPNVRGHVAIAQTIFQDLAAAGVWKKLIDQQN